MNKIPSDHHFVDRVGDKVVTQDARCELRTKHVTVNASTQESTRRRAARGQPSSLQNVDDRGYVYVGEAADGQIVTSAIDFTDPEDDTRKALPTTPLAARRRISVKNHSAGVTL